MPINEGDDLVIEYNDGSTLFYLIENVQYGTEYHIANRPGTLDDDVIFVFDDSTTFSIEWVGGEFIIPTQKLEIYASSNLIGIATQTEAINVAYVYRSSGDVSEDINYSEFKVDFYIDKSTVENYNELNYWALIQPIMFYYVALDQIYHEWASRRNIDFENITLYSSYDLTGVELFSYDWNQYTQLNHAGFKKGNSAKITVSYNFPWSTVPYYSSFYINLR